MALQFCRDCRRPVSDQAKVCFACGAPTRKRIGTLGVVLTFMTLAVLLWLLWP